MTQRIELLDFYHHESAEQKSSRVEFGTSATATHLGNETARGASIPAGEALVELEAVNEMVHDE